MEKKTFLRISGISSFALSVALIVGALIGLLTVFDAILGIIIILLIPRLKINQEKAIEMAIGERNKLMSSEINERRCNDLTPPFWVVNWIWLLCMVAVGYLVIRPTVNFAFTSYHTTEVTDFTIAIFIFGIVCLILLMGFSLSFYTISISECGLFFRFPLILPGVYQLEITNFENIKCRWKFIKIVMLKDLGNKRIFVWRNGEFKEKMDKALQYKNRTEYRV